LDSISNPVLSDDEEVIQIDFRRYVTAVRKYAWVILAIVVASITCAVLYTSRQPEIFQATASLQIEPRMPDVLGQGQDIVAVGAGAGGNTSEYYKAQREILRSYQLLRRTVETNDLHLKLTTARERDGRGQDEVYDLATQRLAANLKITYPEQNRIMYVTVRSQDPKLAADVANAHVSTYEAYSRGLLSNDTQKASRWLASEFDAAEKALRKSETELYSFQKDNSLLGVSLEDRQNLVVTNITSYSQRLNDARAKRIEVGARLDRLHAAQVIGIEDSPILAMTPSSTVDNLQASYYSESTAFLEVAKNYGPKSAEYIGQKAKVDAIYKSLQAEVNRAVGAAQEEHKAIIATEKALMAEVERHKNEALELGPKFVLYNELSRRKKSDEDRYNILVARLSTSEMTSRIDQINVRSLDPARVPEHPVSPDMRMNVLLAGALSLFLGVGIAVLLAFLDRSVKSVEDAQAAADAPVLGVIPLLAESELPQNDDRARDLYVHQHPTSRVAECCRSLRTNIVFSGADRPLKTLVVSSPNPREGKTTTVMYLGTTIAQSGQRVLLVDTDMRRPRLHASPGVSRQKGLSNLVVGEESYEDVIKSTEIPNLFVLPCGPLPPNPAELLMTKRFSAVLKELESRFDRVILDSPPLQAVTDAVVLAKQADGMVLVMRSGKTLRDEVHRAVRQVRSVEGTIVGVILNEFDIQGRSNHYYKYYGYGEGLKEAEPAV
jgi:succinoglycan biosynthesis transport protein ExoP